MRTIIKFFKKHKWSLLVILFSLGIVIAPFISGFFSTTIADILGCELRDKNPIPCYILGFNIGGVLHTMLIAVWLIFYSVPLGLFLLVLGIISFIVELFGV